MVGEDALPAPRRFLAGGSVEEEAEEGGASAVRRSIFECVARVNFINEIQVHSSLLPYLFLRGAKLTRL